MWSGNYSIFIYQSTIQQPNYSYMHAWTWLSHRNKVEKSKPQKNIFSRMYRRVKTPIYYPSIWHIVDAHHCLLSDWKTSKGIINTRFWTAVTSGRKNKDIIMRGHTGTLYDTGDVHQQGVIDYFPNKLTNSYFIQFLEFFQSNM